MLSQDKAIGQRIRQLRRQAGVTQAQLAQKLGISAQQLQKYEKGSNKISASRLILLAEIFDLSVIAFLEGKEETEREGMSDKSVIRLVRLYTRISSPELRQLLMLSAGVYSRM